MGIVMMQTGPSQRIAEAACWPHRPGSGDGLVRTCRCLGRPCATGLRVPAKRLGRSTQSITSDHKPEISVMKGGNVPFIPLLPSRGGDSDESVIKIAQKFKLCSESRQPIDSDSDSNLTSPERR